MTRHMFAALFAVVVGFWTASCVSTTMTVATLKRPAADVSVRTELLRKVRTMVVLPFDTSEKKEITYLPAPPWPPQTSKRRYPYANAGEIVSDTVAREIEKSFSFSVLDRTKLKTVLDEHDLQQTDLFDPSFAVNVGKLLSAEAVLYGRVNICCLDSQYKYDGNGRVSQEIAIVNIDLKVIDVKTGGLLLTAHHELTSQSLMNHPVLMINTEILKNPSRYSAEIPGLDAVVSAVVKDCTGPLIAAKVEKR